MTHGSFRAPRRPRTRLLAVAAIGAAITLHAARAGLASDVAAAPYDVILRHGTIVDGTGAPRYRADIAIAGDRIARIGDLAGARATLDLDVKGFMVAPGFINIHSHAIPAALPTAENMLTQGVTTEILNPDGGGPLDLHGQLQTLAAGGLAVNVAAYIGFNSVWASVMGPANRRPSSAEIDSMRSLIVHGLEAGAFGVAAGLDYKPAYFATTDEVISIVSPAKPWRTNFTNHDRLTPESGYSSRAGMAETMRIGEQAGLVPVFTHMKLQGHEQGSAGEMLETMRRSTASGHYVAADAYPYLAGQTGLGALIIPGWAQDGGRAKMLERFADPEQRARIVKESDEAIAARFGDATAIYLNESQRQLADVMRDMQLTSPGEAVVRVLEKESPSAILRFGAEPDLIELRQYPATSVACDCGAIPANEMRGHPRYYGTFPRVLGHYVRETKALTWEAAVRQMSGLPASTIGLVDRGVLAPGMAADIAVFDSATVIDHATYAEPTKRSDGVRFVLVNGRLALKDGAPTGERGGRALARTSNMPSRPTHYDAARTVSARAMALASDGATNGIDGPLALALDVRQSADARRPTGTLRITRARGGPALDVVELGELQVDEGWASVTGMARLRPSGETRAFTVIVDRADPRAADGAGTVVVDVEGVGRFRGALTSGSVRLGTR